jgi:hypothetical protein
MICTAPWARISLMFLLLTFIYILQQTLAVPIPGTILEDRAASTCTGTSCRSLWNIVWSCVVTIFACTWVAVHPNVPIPDKSAHRRWYSRPLRRVRIMLCALICPELVIMWAWRQRIIASSMSQTLEGVAVDRQKNSLILTSLSHRLVAGAWILCSHGRFR